MKFYQTKIAGLLVATVLSASTVGVGYLLQTASAQDNKGKTHQREGRRGEHGKARMEKMAQELNLTESQKTRMREVMKQSREKSQKIRNDKSLSPEQKRTRMREIRMDSKKRMDAILTPEQKRKLEAKRAERRKQFQKNGNKAGAKKRPETGVKFRECRDNLGRKWKGAIATGFRAFYLVCVEKKFM